MLFYVFCILDSGFIYFSSLFIDGVFTNQDAHHSWSASWACWFKNTAISLAHTRNMRACSVGTAICCASFAICSRLRLARSRCCSIKPASVVRYTELLVVLQRSSSRIVWQVETSEVFCVRFVKHSSNGLNWFRNTDWWW